MSPSAGVEGHDDLSRPLGDGVIPESVVAKTERHWLYVVIGVLALIVLVIVVTGLTDNLHPPSSAETIDPARVYQSAEFSESNLGAAQEAGGRVTVRMIAQQYSFVPACVTVPAGAAVTFRIASADVIHGFLIADTNVNTMVVPGYISSVATRFDRPGTYHMPCHEFCGLGHAGMAAEVRVVPAAAYPRLSSLERLRCDAQ